MVRTKAWCIAGISGVALLGSVGYAIAMRTPPGPPRAEVLMPSQRIIAESGVEKVFAEYRISNRGGRDLIIHKTESSCACSVTSIDPKVIPPGGEGVIKVSATPPAAGERTVAFRVETNSEPEPNLALEMTTIGNQPVPFLVNGPDLIQFGSISAGSKPVETLALTTHERAADPPWLDKVRTDLPYLKVTGGFVEKGSRLGDVIIRRYQFHAELTAPAAAGAFRGHVILSGAKGPEIRLDVQGSVRPPISVTPPSLVAQALPGELVELSVMIVADGDKPIDVQPSDENDAKLDVRRDKGRDNMAVFQIVPRESVSSPIETTLVFRTNHPKAPIVRVPVSIRPTDEPKAKAGDPAPR